MNTCAVSQVGFHDDDDDDEDLATFIANRRRYRGTVNAQGESREISRATCSGEQSVGRPVHQDEYSIAPNPVHRAITRTPSAALDDICWQDEEGAEAQGTDRGKSSLWDQNYIDGPLDPDWLAISPDCHARELPHSSLFVQQDNDAKASLRSRNEIPPDRLLPSDYDSDLDTIDAVHTEARHYSPGHMQAGHDKDSTRTTTMRDVFLQKDYINSIRKNPYTSGIFAYEGLSKQEAIAKIRLQANTKRRSDPGKKVSLKVTCKSVPRSKSSYQHKGPHPHNKSLLQLPVQKRKPSKGANTVSNQAPIQLSPTSVSSRSYSVAQRMSPGAPEQTTKAHGRSTTPQRSILGSDNANLIGYLRQNAQKYNAALDRVGCDYVRDSVKWHFLKSQIQPDINKYEQLLRCKKKTDVGSLKIALDEWDMDIGVRVIVQKYMMYTSLLKSISSPKLNSPDNTH